MRFSRWLALVLLAGCPTPPDEPTDTEGTDRGADTDADSERDCPDEATYVVDCDGDGWFTRPTLFCDPPGAAESERLCGTQDAQFRLHDNTMEEDCDDSEPTRNPAAEETADDGVDSDCDGEDNNPTDTDNDGIPDAVDTDDDNDGFADDADCAPRDAAIFPGAIEACDGVDSDCDNSLVDQFDDFDLDDTPDCVDADDDNDGTADDDDCGPLNPDLHRGAAEICDGIDNNCDGVLGPTEMDLDNDGVSECAGDCDDNDPTRVPGADEVCDGRDNNCDGVVPANEADDDADGHRICSGDCDDGNPDISPTAVELCDGIDTDCTPDSNEVDGDNDGWLACAGDCDDDDPTRHPLAPEACDGLDTDCDGIVPVWEFDADGDGASGCQGDCDDNDVTLHPAAPELCDAIDNNCDGAVDQQGTGETCTLRGTDTDVEGFGRNNVQSNTTANHYVNLPYTHGDLVDFEIRTSFWAAPYEQSAGGPDCELAVFMPSMGFNAAPVVLVNGMGEHNHFSQVYECDALTWHDSARRPWTWDRTCSDTSYQPQSPFANYTDLRHHGLWRLRTQCFWGFGFGQVSEFTVEADVAVPSGTFAPECGWRDTFDQTPSHSLQTAQTLPPGGHYGLINNGNGWVATEGAGRWAPDYAEMYRIVVPAGSTATVYVGIAGASPGSVRLMDAAGTTLHQTPADVGHILEHTAGTTAEEVFVQVSTADCAEYGIELVLSSYPDHPTPQCEDALDADQGHPSIVYPLFIEPGLYSDLRVGPYDGQQDWYLFELMPEDSIRLTLRHEPADGDLDLRITDALGRSLLEGVNGTGQEVLIGQSNTGGNFYASVTLNGPPTCIDYSLEYERINL